MMKKMILFLFCSFLFLPLSAMAADTQRYMNFAVFQKADPHADWEYESIVVGNFGDFIDSMGTHAHPLLITRSAGVQDGDVLSMQTDVLREEGDALGDFGVNCTMSFMDESTPDQGSYLIGGMCKVLMKGGGQDLDKTIIVIPANVPEAVDNESIWLLLDEDEETGTAFYANVGH